MPTIELPPYYRVTTVSSPPVMQAPSPPGQLPVSLFITPGASFGDGTHETTQLCLLALGYLLRSRVKPRRTLDFGSGNGILGLAAAKAGSFVEAVDIDPMALGEVDCNAQLNGVRQQFDIRAAMSADGCPFELVVANILSGVLLNYAEALAVRLSHLGFLLLSGITSTDVPSQLTKYRPLLPGHDVAIYERGFWRALLFSPRTQ